MEVSKTKDSKDKRNRCFGNSIKLLGDYHDNEWARPVYDDKKLFEMLILEGAQAGLSWLTVLKKRQGYKQAFLDFDVEKVANMTDQQLDKLKTNPEIIRNRLKIYSARKNAKVFIKIQQEFGSFSNYLWGYVGNKPIKGNWDSLDKMPATSKLSDKISIDLKSRGMKFVGSTIIYAYIQSVGILNDHIKTCWLYES